jgi:hypothetical protein
MRGRKAFWLIAAMLLIAIGCTRSAEAGLFRRCCGRLAALRPFRGCLFNGDRGRAVSSGCRSCATSVADTTTPSQPPTDLPPTPSPNDQRPGAIEATAPLTAESTGPTVLSAEQTEAPPIDTDRLPPTPMQE